jgi:hypothetical protein
VRLRSGREQIDDVEIRAVDAGDCAVDVSEAAIDEAAPGCNVVSTQRFASASS